MPQGRIAPAAFDAPHISPVHPGLVPSASCDQPLFLAEIADSPADGLGDGSVQRSEIQGLQRLRDHMQRVADLMQAGNADGAAEAYRMAIRLARPLIRRTN